VGLELNGTHQLLVCVDDLNLLRDNMDTIKKNIETLIVASKEVGVEINTKKSKYMLLCHHQNAGQNHNINIANRSLKKCGTVQISGDSSTNSEFDSGES
jgi:hypothetical protein